mmetsp:Transcript_30906/g.65319  ORF Transcript_30906/g.65319 Transcript_30906/m.65319 type:complete len:240 (-) Transcript_30906:95-814(-)
MTTPNKAPEKQYRDVKERTSPVRKKSTRPTMSKKSPYKSPVRACKSRAKQYSTAKKLSPTRKSIANSTTKQEKMQARLRAREWAKKELGQKKSAPLSPTQVDSSRIIVIDDDNCEEEEPKGRVHNVKAATIDKYEKPCAKCETLHQRMVNLDIEKQEMKKTVSGIFDEPSKGDDIFYDALEYLPKQHDFAVEDVSDEEDDEIRDLRSNRRNCAPSDGQWMEPLEPAGISHSTFVPKQDP